jgi:hypothetical protein
MKGTPFSLSFLIQNLMNFRHDHKSVFERFSERQIWAKENHSLGTIGHLHSKFYWQLIKQIVVLLNTEILQWICVTMSYLNEAISSIKVFPQKLEFLDHQGQSTLICRSFTAPSTAPRS